MPVADEPPPPARMMASDLTQCEHNNGMPYFFDSNAIFYKINEKKIFFLCFFYLIVILVPK